MSYYGNTPNNTYKIFRSIYSSGTTSLDVANNTYDILRASYDTTNNALNVRFVDDTIDSNLTITGNLTVSGATISAQNLQVENNFITVNSGETGSGVTLGTAGLTIDRGSGTDYKFEFQESDDTFRVGEDGSTVAVAGREDTPTDNELAVWESATNTFITNDTSVTTSTIYPRTDATYTLGGPGANWAALNLSTGIYNDSTQMIDLSNTATTNIKTSLTMDGAIVSAGIYPSVDGTRYLGLSSKNYNRLYLSNSIYNGLTEMVDFSDTGLTEVKTPLSVIHMIGWECTAETSASAYYGGQSPAIALGYKTFAGSGTTGSWGNGGNVAFGQFTTSSGKYGGSFSAGYKTIASGSYSTASGSYTTASGYGSTAIGHNSIASGQYSYAEGETAVASGNVSHAEGFFTIASHKYAHAEGFVTRAENEGAHSGGRGYGSGGDYVFVTASGLSSFNHSYVTNNTDVTGATGDYSAILGGTDNSVTADNSVVLGGSSIVGNVADTVYVPSFEITTQAESSFIMADAYSGARYNMILSGGTLTAVAI